MKIVFATNNRNKLKEVKALLPDFDILGLEDIGCKEEIPETSNTLEGNAKIKADFITQKYGYNCFADDTGLEVESLNNEPGVYSARYAGKPSDSQKNMAKILTKMQGLKNRSAQFKTIIALNLNASSYIFEGICRGSILQEKVGTEGFGYDPIFKPVGSSLSFSQMTMKEKGELSHRGKAIEQLTNFLNSL